MIYVDDHKIEVKAKQVRKGDTFRYEGKIRTVSKVTKQTTLDGTPRVQIDLTGYYPLWRDANEPMMLKSRAKV
jgi:hypothetical protein